MRACITRNQIVQQLRQLLEKRLQISFAYLHGSFLSGPAHNDIDVALYLESLPADTFDYEMSLSVELTRALHQPVDVHLLNGAPLGFQHQVLQGRPLFARDEEFLTDFIEHVANEYTAFAYYSF